MASVWLLSSLLLLLLQLVGMDVEQYPDDVRQGPST
jgi:hypothetical protein